MHKMKLIQAHTLAHLHTRIAKYAHKGVDKIYSSLLLSFFFNIFIYNSLHAHTDLASPTHTHTHT